MFSLKLVQYSAVHAYLEQSCGRGGGLSPLKLDEEHWLNHQYLSRRLFDFGNIILVLTLIIGGAHQGLEGLTPQIFPHICGCVLKASY